MSYDCNDGPATLDVELVVTDNAENVDSDDAIIEVANVAPICDGISGTTDMAIGGTATFTGSFHDVAADEPLTDLIWSFGDGNGVTDINPANHIYEVAGNMTVKLTVIDKDGGNDTCIHYIDVVDPTVLDAQEVAAFYPLDADFGVGDNRFMHGLSGASENCVLIEGPTNLEVLDQGGDQYCTVRWDRSNGGIANPTNDQRGTDTVLVRVHNDTGYEYYVFDVTVWSWIIEMNEGWNLISIPLVPESGNDIEEVFLNQLGEDGQNVLPGGTEYVVKSYQYDGVSGSDWLMSRRSGYGDLEVVKPGYGYWIKSTGEAKIRGMGVKDDNGLPTPEIKVETHEWQMVGRYGIIGEDSWDMMEGRAHGALGEVPAMSEISRGSQNELHLVESDGLGGYASTDELINNIGYWLRVENEQGYTSLYEEYSPLPNDDTYYLNN
jgi:hypothetical protein